MSAENEKATPPPSNGRFSWRRSKQLDKLDSDSSSPSPEDRASPDLGLTAPLEEDSKPVSFTGLFRSVLSPLFSPLSFNISFSFTTRTELTFNAIGLVAAVAAGAAQVCVLYVILSSPNL